MFTLHSGAVAPKKSNRPFRTTSRVLLDSISVPVVKIVELYGLTQVSPTLKKFADKTNSITKSKGRFGRAINALSWVPISYSLTQLGSFLGKACAGLGSSLSNALGFGIAYAHPSLISFTIKKLSGKKDGEVGISRLLEAAAMADLLAWPALIFSLGSGLPDIPSKSVSVGTVVGATFISSVVGLTVWAAGVTFWWTKIVRKESLNFVNGLTSFVKGLKSSVHPVNCPTPANAYEEAGVLIGVASLIVGLQRYVIRIVSAGIIANMGVSSSEFIHNLFSFTSTMDWLNAMAAGISNSFIENIIKRRNKDLLTDS